jgi:trans-aconitate 2-methyltransferase
MDEKNTDTAPGLRTAGSEAVREFYDEFSVSRMQRYLQKGNLRIERAIKRILPFVASDSTVLEIGCGIGLVTERLAQAVPAGAVWSYDISEKNIQQARERVHASNVNFRRGDILHDFDDVRAWIPVPVQLVVMVDVIEHLPLATHSALLHNLGTIMRTDGSVILTFPSPDYQRHLRETSPQKLQIIDEIVELEHVLSIATRNGFRIRHFSLEDVWLRNQYVHCVLARSLSLDRV